MELPAADTTWLQRHMFTCPSKKLFYLDCPGCGLQRSLLALLQGDLSASWNLYPPLLFIMATVIFLALHVAFGFKNGAHFLKILFIITVAAMAVNYIYKILNHQLI
ncbi:MAG TPA: DUF2752 domain-containing protein [Flavipsychrobacter sp.]|nr:DUF2752 domain-containing protein [Flavipsychrobacter sp.]